MLKLSNEPCNQVKLKTSWYHFLATPSPVCGTNILSNLFQLRGWHTQRKTHSNTVFAFTLFHDADIWAFIEFSTECHTIITTRSSKLNVMETTQFTTTAFHMAWSWSFFVFSLDFLIRLHQVYIFRKWRQNCATTAFRVTDDFTQCVTWTMHFGVEVLEAIFSHHLNLILSNSE